MPQYDYGVIDPDHTSGSALANMLTLFSQAVRTGHSGTQRPYYAQRGTIWIYDDLTRYMYLLMYDGVDDIYLGTLDTVTNTFTVPTETVTLASLGGVPQARRIDTFGSLAGGGDLTANRGLALVNDSARPGGSRYYGTDPSGIKGFHPLPVAGKATPALQAYLVPGTYSFAVPAGVSRVWVQMRGARGGNMTVTYPHPETGAPGGGETLTYFGGLGGVLMGTVGVTAGGSVTVHIGHPGLDISVNYGPWYAAGPGGNTSFGAVTAHGGTGAQTVWNGSANVPQHGAEGSMNGAGENVFNGAWTLHSPPVGNNAYCLIWYWP
jgi:hypothetical protein